MSEHARIEQIERLFPQDGPHDADSVIDAASGVSALTAYLANAARPGTDALGWIATIDHIVGALGSAIGDVDQLLRQLAATAEWHAAHNPTLYDDRGDRPAGDTALALAAALSGEVRTAAAELARALTTARGLSTHLGNND